MSIVVDTQENVERCGCPSCPSYPGDGGLFCARGKSSKDVAMRECVCEHCAVYQHYDLIGAYYCREGACGACGEGPQ